MSAKENSNDHSHLSGLKPIETIYGNYRFRSRLEARWAVFFDVAGIEWRYEPEGFDLSEVQVPYEPKDPELTTPPLWYLPDFYLPKQGYWIEIKAQRPSPREVFMMRRLVMGTGKEGFIFWGDIRMPAEIMRSHRSEDFIDPSAWGYSRHEQPLSWSYSDLDFEELLDPGFAKAAPYPKVSSSTHNQWCVCPRCGLLGITSYGNARFLKCGCIRLGREGGDYEEEIVDQLDPYYTDQAPRLIEAYTAARQARFERKSLPNTRDSPLRASLNQERQRVDHLEAKLQRIREVLEEGDI